VSKSSRKRKRRVRRSQPAKVELARATRELGPSAPGRHVLSGLRRTLGPLSRVTAVILAAIGYATGIAGLIALRPKINITPLDPTFVEKPSQVPFEIRNDTPYSVKDLDVFCVIHYFKTDGPDDASKVEFYGLVAHDKRWAVATLRSNGARTIGCTPAVSSRRTPKLGDISIVTKVRAFGLSFQNCHRFAGVQGTPRWRWFEKPCTDEDDQAIANGPFFPAADDDS
jgi:hypothetical protein